MSADLIALAEQLRDSGKLRWYAGMYADRHGRVIAVDAGDPVVCGYDAPLASHQVLPDLSDPLTAASLLLMAREATKDPGLYVRPAVVNLGDGILRLTGWRVCSEVHACSFGSGPTELEALVAAVLAAPVRP